MCRESSKTGVRDKGKEQKRLQRETTEGVWGAETVEPWRQACQCRNVWGKKVGGKNWKTHRAREESRRVSKAWKKLDITSSWGVITDWKVDTVRGKKAWQSSKRDRELSKRSQREAGVPASIWMSLLPWLIPEPPILLPRCLAWPLSRCSMLSRQL